MIRLIRKRSSGLPGEDCFAGSPFHKGFPAVSLCVCPAKGGRKMRSNWKKVKEVCFRFLGFLETVSGFLSSPGERWRLIP
ncbi:hypothetical protein ABH19_01475 [Leptospirillum sp. Group II 'CF-1']|nr:hypothetical protein ABH19_01475 [Leptospirillum sp. Group II 'CF-1']